MSRRRIPWLAVGLLILASLACNAFAGDVEPALIPPTPPAIVTEATDVPSGQEQEDNGLVATATVIGETTAGTSVASLADPLVTVLVDLNVRKGPGVQYDRISFMFEGESARIVGRDPATGWWRIECPRRVDATECWVSGGARFTSAVNADSVPVAAVPPTPTPPIPTPTAESAAASGVGGLLVYESEGQLLAVRLDLGQDPPAAAVPTVLAENDHPMVPFIAPDGQKIAYLVDAPAQDELHIINLDGSRDRTLVLSSMIPQTIQSQSSDLVVDIGAIQWLADSQTIAFNSAIISLTGPGFVWQDDLWTVSLDGLLIERFAAGTGGGAFAISSKNQVIMSQSEAIIRAALDGSKRETVVTFDFVNTASEFAYHPQPQWTADGDEAFVAIPGSEPFAPDAQVTLYRIPAVGESEVLQVVPGNVLVNPIEWSADGDALAFVQQPTDGANAPQSLLLADGNADAIIEYSSGRGLQFLAWSPDGGHFLYGNDRAFAIGRLGATAIERTTTGRTIDVRWLSPATYVVATGSGDRWRLESGNLLGESRLLASIQADTVRFDAWAP